MFLLLISFVKMWSVCVYVCVLKGAGDKGWENVFLPPNVNFAGDPLGGAAVWRLPLAQGVILEPRDRDRVPRRAPGAWSLLLPLPVSLPLSLSLCVTIINKLKKMFKKNFLEEKQISGEKWQVMSIEEYRVYLVIFWGHGPTPSRDVQSSGFNIP